MQTQTTPAKSGRGKAIAVVLVIVVIAAAAGGYYFLFGTGSSKAAVNIASGTGANQSLNFNPSSITVKANSVVTFTNGDSTTHTVTFTSGPSGVDLASISDSSLAAGASYSVTLTVPGTYQYHCTIHAWMQGTITVT